MGGWLYSDYNASLSSNWTELDLTGTELGKNDHYMVSMGHSALVCGCSYYIPSLVAKICGLSLAKTPSPPSHIHSIVPFRIADKYVK